MKTALRENGDENNSKTYNSNNPSRGILKGAPWFSPSHDDWLINLENDYIVSIFIDVFFYFFEKIIICRCWMEKKKMREGILGVQKKSVGAEQVKNNVLPNLPLFMFMPLLPHSNNVNIKTLLFLTCTPTFTKLLWTQFFNFSMIFEKHCVYIHSRKNLIEEQLYAIN